MSSSCSKSHAFHAGIPRVLPQRFATLLLLAISLEFLFPTTKHAYSAEKPDAPNVLLIMADDMGYSDAGCYGSEIATPNLDSLANGGLRFSQFYNTARCWPSRAALLSGYYAQQVRRDTVPGVKSGGQGVRPKWAKLLPDMLASAGYRSYHSGKWHVDGKPLEQGFHRSYSLNDHDRHFGPKVHTEDDKPLPAATTQSGYYSSTAIADYAIKFLREHAENHSSQPFLEFVAFTAPHFPLHAPQEDIDRVRSKYLAGWDTLRTARWNKLQSFGLAGMKLSAMERDLGPPYPFPEAIAKLGPNEVNRPIVWNDLSPSQREFQAAKMAIHAAMIERMDREIGRILDQLRTMKRFENTLIFFVSDNGASAEIMVRGDGHDLQAAAGSAATYLSLGPGWSSVANTPFRRHKTWVHEGGIATPCIVHWPKGIAAKNELRHAPGHLIDIVPTILDVAGCRPEKSPDAPPLPGLSLKPLFAKDEAVKHETLWWLHEGNRALRKGNWKIVAAGKDSPWELYDLSRDRAEEDNLATKFPEKVAELNAEWSQQFETYSATARKEAPSDQKPKSAQ